jgi:serine carboxypeptidase-like clade 1
MIALLSLALGAPAADEITSLPGWSPKPLPSRMWSGFINVSAAAGRPMQVHYWLLNSEKDPSTDPTILWTNGGPGASSMFGLLVELGPLVLNDDSLATDDYRKTGVPTLYKNPYSWTQLGSVVMFDWPPPVGFSYCDEPKGGGKSCGDWDDERMATIQYAALKGFYEKFPERQKLDLFLTGESYAGIYVPKLAQQILQHKDKEVYPQLKGFAVGDGCLGTETGVCGGGFGPWWDVIFLYGHGQISTILFDEIVNTCGMEYLKHGGTEPKGCKDALGKVATEAGGYFAYGLYDDCIYQEGLGRRRRLSVAPHGGLSEGHAALLGFADHRAVGGAVNDYVCGGGVAQTLWTNVSSVRTALHVPVDSLFFNGDNGEGMVYKPSEKNLMPFYQQVASETALRVLIYNGDADPSINSFMAQNWTSSLGFTPTQTWRPWTLDSCLRMGGYVTRYKERLDYLTIRGSGHMVPEFKPAPALEFMRAWLADEDYKPYVKTCTTPPQ